MTDDSVYSCNVGTYFIITKKKQTNIINCENNNWFEVKK